MRIAVLGRTRMLTLSAQALNERGHDIVLVVAPSAPRYAPDREEFRALADQLSCPFLAVPNLTDAETLAALAHSGAEVAISVNWPTIVPPPVLELFTHGVLNAHAGDLPRHRGNATIAWAILTGEPAVVLTIHRMDCGLDSGPVFAKRAHPITETTYVGDVYAFCERATPELFIQVVDGLARGALEPVPQPDGPEGSLRCFPRTPEDGWIDWSQDATALARLVRASAEPFEGAYTAHGDKRLTIWRARGEPLAFEHLGVPGQVVELRDERGEVAVLTGAGVLVLERVQSGQGPVVPAGKLLRSTRLRLGLHLPTRLTELERRVAALERDLSRHVAP